MLARMPTEDPIAGRVALVTGASSGIGLAVATKLFAAGARVALVARTASKLEAAARGLGLDRAGAFPCDVTDLARLAEIPAAVIARFGRLDILVNNAGVNHRGSILDHSPEALAEVITTNLTAPVYLTRACAPLLRAGGTVVNVASLAGMVPVEHEAAYSASKAGLRAFTRVIAGDLADLGVRACSVCPGPVDTNFFGDVSRVPDLVFSQPMSSPDQVADAVLDAIRGGPHEVALPAMSGRLATLGYLFPSLAELVKPLLRKRGAVNKARYLARRQAAT
jgi:NAD(P)-dependent dehydrogenase (short-subunit alcohol dehydrogenase family)